MKMGKNTKPNQGLRFLFVNTTHKCPKCSLYLAVNISLQTEYPEGPLCPSGITGCGMPWSTWRGRPSGTSRSGCWSVSGTGHSGSSCPGGWSSAQSCRSGSQFPAAGFSSPGMTCLHCSLSTHRPHIFGRPGGPPGHRGSISYAAAKHC